MKASNLEAAKVYFQFDYSRVLKVFDIVSYYNLLIVFVQAFAKDDRYDRIIPLRRAHQ